MKVKSKLKQLDLSSIGLQYNQKYPSSIPPSVRKQNETIFKKLQPSNRENKQVIGMTEKDKSFSQQEKETQFQSKLKVYTTLNDKQNTTFEGYSLPTYEGHLQENKNRVKSQQRTITLFSNSNSLYTQNDSPLSSQRENVRQSKQSGTIPIINTNNTQMDDADTYDNSPTRFKLYTSIQQDKSRNQFTSLEQKQKKYGFKQSTSLTRNQQRLQNYHLPSLDSNYQKKKSLNNSLSQRRTPTGRNNLKKSFHVQSSYQPLMHSQKQSPRKTPTKNQRNSSHKSLFRKSINDNSFFASKESGKQSIIDMAEEEVLQKQFYQFLGQIVLSQSDFNIYLESFKSTQTVSALKHFIDAYSKQERRFNRYQEEIAKKAFQSKFDIYCLKEQLEKCQKLIEETQRIQSSMILSSSTTLEKDELNFSKMDKIIDRFILSMKEYTDLFEFLYKFINTRISLTKYLQTIQHEFSAKSQLQALRMNHKTIQEIQINESLWQKIMLDFHLEAQNLQHLCLNQNQVSKLFSCLEIEITQITHTPPNQVDSLLNALIDSARGFLYRRNIITLCYYLSKPLALRAKEVKQQINEEKQEMIDKLRENYLVILNSLELLFLERICLRSRSQEYEKEVLDLVLPSLYLLIEIADQTGLKSQYCLSSMANTLINIKNNHQQYYFVCRFYTLPADKPFFSQMSIFLEILQSQGMSNLIKKMSLLKAELNMTPYSIQQGIYKYKRQEKAISNLISISNKIEENSKIQPSIFTEIHPESLFESNQEYMEEFERQIRTLVESAQPYEDQILKKQQENDVNLLSDIIKGITFLKPSYEIFLHLYQECIQSNFQKLNVDDIFSKLKQNKIDILTQHTILFKNFLYWFLKRKLDFNLIEKSEQDITQFLNCIIDNNEESFINQWISTYKILKRLYIDIDTCRNQLKQNSHSYDELIQIQDNIKCTLNKYVFLNSIFNIFDGTDEQIENRFPSYKDFQEIIKLLSNYAVQIEINKFKTLSQPIQNQIQLNLSHIKKLLHDTNSTSNSTKEQFINIIENMCNQIISSFSQIEINPNQSNRANLINDIGEFLTYKKEKIAILLNRDTHKMVYIIDYDIQQIKNISHLHQQQQTTPNNLTQQYNITLKQSNRNNSPPQQSRKNSQEQGKNPVLQKYRKNSLLQEQRKNSPSLEQKQNSNQTTQRRNSLVQTSIKNNFKMKELRNNSPVLENQQTFKKTNQQQIQGTGNQNNHQLPQQQQQSNSSNIQQQIKLNILSEFGILTNNSDFPQKVVDTLTKQICQVKVIKKKTNTTNQNIEVSPINNNSQNKGVSKQERVLKYQVKKCSVLVQIDIPYNSCELTIFEEKTGKQISKLDECQSGMTEVELKLESLCSQLTCIFSKKQSQDSFDRISYKKQLNVYSFIPNYLQALLIPNNFKENEFINIYLKCKQQDKADKLFNKEEGCILKFRDLQNNQEIQFNQTRSSNYNICYHLPHDTKNTPTLIYLSNINLNEQDLKDSGMEIYIYMRKDNTSLQKSEQKIEIMNSILDCKQNQVKSKEWQIAKYDNESSQMQVINTIVNINEQSCMKINIIE